VRKEAAGSREPLEGQTVQAKKFIEMREKVVKAEVERDRSVA
jgi:hypothetical protein